MNKEMDASVQLYLRAANVNLSTALYYMSNAQEITDNDAFSSALDLSIKEVSQHFKTIQGMIDELSK